MEQTYFINGKETKVKVNSNTEEFISVSLDGKSFDFKVLHRDGDTTYLQDGNDIVAVNSYEIDGKRHVFVDGATVIVEKKGLRRAGNNVESEGSLLSPMPGKIFKVLKSEGEDVTKGDTVLILEAMKMEHAIKATADGTVKKICFKEGELVTGGVQLVEIE